MRTLVCVSLVLLSTLTYADSRTECVNNGLAGVTCDTYNDDGDHVSQTHIQDNGLAGTTIETQDDDSTNNSRDN